MKAEKKNNRLFKVTITEIMKKTVYVEESELKEFTPQEAEQLVSDRWHNSEYILDADDFVGVEFQSEEVTEGGEEDE